MEGEKSNEGERPPRAVHFLGRRGGIEGKEGGGRGIKLVRKRAGRGGLYEKNPKPRRRAGTIKKSFALNAEKIQGKNKRLANTKRVRGGLGKKEKLRGGDVHHHREMIQKKKRGSLPRQGEKNFQKGSFKKRSNLP